MAILKLKNAGDTATLHITKCEAVEGSFGEQIKFTATNGDQLFLPRESADRQLARQGFADGEMVLYSDVDGTTLTFSRDMNKKPGAAPYWSIARVVEADTAPRQSLAERGKARATQVAEARRALQVAKGESGPSMGKLPFDDEAPPPDDADNPYSEEDGLPPVTAGAAQQSLADARHAKREGVIDAYRVAVAAAWDMWGPDTEASVVQAGAATILIQFDRVGALR